MASDPSEPITILFLGHASAALSGRAAAYEDAVLPLLADHGARLVYRGRRRADQDPARPFEVHLLWFPNRAGFDSYLADAPRAALLEQFGEVFTAKEILEVETISSEPLPR